MSTYQDSLKEYIKRHKADTLKAMRDLALTESDFFIQRHIEEKMLEFPVEIL